MSRRCILAFAFFVSVLPAKAGIWPEQLWEYKRTQLAQVKVEAQPVWDEYGLEAAERAEYGSPKGKFAATAYRLKDPTSALAVSQWLAKPAERLGNYILVFENGFTPDKQTHDVLQVQLPKLDQSPLPTLPDYLPANDVISASKRYVIGPVSLAKFEPRIAPSVAGFSMGAEGQLAKYRSPAGELNLAIFAYPTPQIARDRAPEFQKISGAVVKRTGPLVAVTIAPPNADEAERLLAKVNYQARLTWNEKLPKPEGNMGDLLIGIATLVGALIGFTIFAGVGFAAIRIGWRKWSGRGPEEDEMVTLHLE